MGKGPGPQPDDNEVLFTIAATFQNLSESDKKSIEDDLTTLLLSLGSGNVTFDSFQPGSSKVKAYYDFEIDKNDLISKIVKENDIVTVGTKKWVITKVDTTRLIYENWLVLITIDDVGLCSCPLTYTVNYGDFGTTTIPDVITIPDDILKTSILHIILGGSNTAPLTITQNLFSGCTSLEQFVFGIDMSFTMGNFLFDGCEALEEIDIPNTLTSLGAGIFTGCKNLLSVNFNNNTNITSIPGETFAGCSSLEEITIPPNVTSIGEEAFSNCRRLEIVIIPEKVTEINDFAFAECFALESVTFQGEPEVTIGNSSFNSCIELKEVNFNDAKVQSIGNNAFFRTPLTEITLPETVTSIGSYAFALCFALESVTFQGEPELQSIGNYAFSGTRLTEFTIPETVTEGNLGVGIFQNTILLTTIRLDNTDLVTIPKDTLSIGFDDPVILDNTGVVENLQVIPIPPPGEGADFDNFLIKNETQAVEFGPGNRQFSGKTNNGQAGQLTTEESSEPGYFRLILVE